MEDPETVLVGEVNVVVVPTEAVQDVEVVLQMDAAETAQAADQLLIQEADVAVLQMDAVVLPHQEGAAVLQVMEDVAAKKVVLLQADEICIETIKEK